MVVYSLYEDIGYVKGNDSVEALFDKVIFADGSTPVFLEEFKDRESAMEKLRIYRNEIDVRGNGKTRVHVFWVQEEHFDDEGRFAYSGDIDYMADRVHVNYM